MRTRIPIRRLLAQGAKLLSLAMWLLAPMGGLYAQLPQPGVRTVFLVSAAPSTDPNLRQFATLDQAVEAARAVKDPLVLLDPGEYTLAGPITTALEFRARSLGTGPLFPVDWTSCAPFAPVSFTPGAVLQSAAGRPALQVNMTNPEARVLLAGIALKAPGGTPAAVVTSGELIGRDGSVAGRVLVKGSSARASFSSLTHTGSLTSGVSAPSGLIGGLVGAYGLKFTVSDRDMALIAVTDGATFLGKNLELTNHSGIGICVDGATARLCGGSIHDIQPVLPAVDYGRGGEVMRGGKLILHATRVYQVYEAGVAAVGSGTQLVADQDSRFEKIYATMAQLGVGILGQSGAAVTVSDGRIVGCSGPGLYLVNGATATVSSTEIRQNQGAGIVAYGGTLTLNQSTVERTTSHPGVGLGLGIYLNSRLYGLANATITGCRIWDNLIAGIWIDGGGGTLAVTGTTLARHPAYTLNNGSSVHGNGIIALDVCSGLTLTGNRYTGNGGAQVFLHGSNATLSGSTYVTNGALDFLQQRCTSACVTPLTEAALAADGLSPSTHILSLCPASELLVYPANTIMFSLREPRAEP